MRTELTQQQSEILNADVKKVFWLFEVDRNNDGTVDYYWSTEAKTYDGHDYTYRIMSFSPLTISMGNPELGIIPETKTTIRASFLGSGIDGIDMSPNNTAISDDRTEADATTGWVAKDAPDTFESTSSGSPYQGSYHFHVVNTLGAWRGFRKNDFTWVAGQTYRLVFWYKKVSGVPVQVYIYDGDGSYLTSVGGLSSTNYSLVSIEFTPTVNGSLGEIRIETANGVGEFYVDKLTLVPVNNTYASDFEGASITVRLVGEATLDLTPDDTAVSDTRTEANATTGWSSYNAPDTFESTANGDPRMGDYHFHVVVTPDKSAGFIKTGLSFVSGETYKFKFDCKRVSGAPIVAQITDGDGITTTAHLYSNTEYESKEVSFTSAYTGSEGKIAFFTYSDPGEFYIDNVRFIRTTPYEDELMSWRFKVKTANSVNQVLTLQCQDWFTAYLEGDYPNTPLISHLFPADIMKDDNICVPIVFGTAFFPIRWIINRLGSLTYVDADTFTVPGNRTGQFQDGQFALVDCGVDGLKKCWVDGDATYDGGTNLTTVHLTAGSDDLTSNIVYVYTDHYLLGPESVTYTIDRARTPLEVNFKSTYLSTDYTFKQGYAYGSDAIKYKNVQLICDDANNDGTNDANGYWGVSGKEMYDVPFKFSRSDLSSMTDPANIAEYIFEDWGIPSSEIDDTSKVAATTIFTARGFELNIGLWYQMPREKLIAKLFTIAGMIPLYRDKIGFKVLTKESQLTIEEDLIEPGSFRINQTFTQKEKDSGYVTWQTDDEPVDQVNKSLIAAKSATDNPSDTTIEAEWCLDSVKAQKAGKLALQRILLKDKTITFTAQGKILTLEPGDMITINPANFGAEGSSYDALITKMTIHEGLQVDVECIKFRDSLDDWDDLSESSIAIPEANTDRGYSPIYQGPRDSVDQTVPKSNEITKTVLIGSNGELKTNDDPATNGGFKATNSELVCYNTSGAERFKAVYAGTDQGDVTIGDYAGGRGLKWDQSEGELTVKVDSNGGVTVSGGGDITLDGSDTDPGVIKFEGTSYAVEMGGDASGIRFAVTPSTDGDITYKLGAPSDWWDSNNYKFRRIWAYCTDQWFASVGTFSGAVNGAAIEVDADISMNEPLIWFQFHEKIGETDAEYKFYYNRILPGVHKTQDIGASANAFDDMYADDFNNVADFLHMDTRSENGEIIPVDDLEVIKGIKPSGKFDLRTGLEFIDDDTLPEWLLTKNKNTGEILYDPDGKPYLSLRTMISLLMGAIRQLDRKKKDK